MFDLNLDLPVHPSKRHPLTGQPLRAVWVRPDGRVMWPVLGGDDTAGGGQGGSGSGSGAGAGTGSSGSGDGSGSSGAGAGGSGSAGTAGTGSGGAGGPAGSGSTGSGGTDLGFPPNTPIAEMTDAQQAAYWRHQSRRHEGRVKDLLGDRPAEDVKKDLDELAQIRRSQQTPAEQALTDRYEQGKRDGARASNTQAAMAIFRGALEANGVTGDDLDELAANFNVAGYVTDTGGIETTKITSFAKRFSPAGTANNGGNGRQRDFGAGRRQQQTERGAAGKAEAQRRFSKTKSGG